MKKRILWLSCHNLLRTFEVETLHNLGYEVFVPKIIPNNINDIPSINDCYDHTLSIPTDILGRLNTTDFFTQNYTSEIIKILNEHFDIVFCSFSPYLVKQIVTHFSGKIVLRAYGLANGFTYTQLLNEFCPGLLTQIAMNKERIFFAQNNFDTHREHHVLAAVHVHLPFCLSKPELEASWQGNLNHILMLQTIPSDQENETLPRFKKYFRKLPCVTTYLEPAFAGDINIISSDQNISLMKRFQESKVLVYTEKKNFLEYYLFIAIAVGIPILYLKGTFLDSILPPDHPGSCCNLKEAKSKAKNILRGNTELINKIREQQQIVYDYYSPKIFAQKWQNVIKKVLSDNVVKKVKRIGVFLPNCYLGGSLNGAKNIAKMLQEGSRTTGENVEVIFSYRAGFYNQHEHFADLQAKGIALRETKWVTLTKQEVATCNEFLNRRNISLTSEEYVVPHDGINNFHDCDFWLIISDRLEKPLAPIKPYGVVVYDYVQRYIPDVIDKAEAIWRIYFEEASLTSVRNAEFILTTTPQTFMDVITYAGINRNKVVLVPTDFNPYEVTPTLQESENYFIWPTNLVIHKNHLLAIQALHTYYTNHNGKFKVLMTGSGTQNLLKEDQKIAHSTTYLEQIKEALAKYPTAKENIIIKGDLSTYEYVNTLANACFLWHPVKVDNGTFSVLEAAYYGIPSLSSDYPQMQYLNDRFKLNLTFFNSNNFNDIAEKLKEMEECYLMKKQLICGREYLEAHSCEKMAPAFWESIRQRLC